MAESISGSLIVDEISKMHINSIPEAWYRTIRMKNQPHAIAILILWDLLYWYKWTELRDEKSGMVIGYKKKFRDNLLQRSYADIAAKFGISKRQATDVISFLQTLGLLKKVFRTINVNGIKCSNVLYIELIPSKIKEFSSEINNISDENKTLDEDTEPQNCDTYHEISGEVYTSEQGEVSTPKRETNTTISHTNSQSISKPCTSKAGKNQTQKYSVFLNSLSETDRSMFEKCVTELYEFRRNIDPKFIRNSSQLLKWQFDLALFANKENRDSQEIYDTLTFALSSKFWSSIMFTPENLIKNYEKIFQKANIKSLSSKVANDKVSFADEINF